MELKGKDFWNHSAEQFSSDQTLGRKFILDPELIRVIGPAFFKNVLDIGCGYGKLTNLLASMGAEKCLGIDFSDELIKIAQNSAREQKLSDKVDFQVLDAKEVSRINRKFDLVLISVLFPHIPNFNDAISIAHGIKKVTAEGSRLIIGEPHPSFDFYMRNRLSNRDFQYFEKGLPYQFTMESGVGSLSSEAYHWRLEDYSWLVYQAGFSIRRILEPTPLPEAEKVDPRWYQDKSRYPSYIVLDCIR